MSHAQQGAFDFDRCLVGPSSTYYVNDQPRSRRTDPATSHAAAESAKDMAQRHHQIILTCLREHGALGKDGIAARTRLDGIAVARRMSELQRLGLAKPTGKTVASTSGRAERVWEAS